MQNRPKIKLKKQPMDTFLDGLVWVILIASISCAAYHYNSLPEKIPMHFNFKGQVDNYGSKYTLWILNGIAVVMAFGLFKLNKYPHVFNYPVDITKENASTQYKLATRIIRWLNVICLLLFCVLNYQIIQIALQPNTSTKKLNFFIYLLIAASVIVPIVLMVKSNKNT